MQPGLSLLKQEFKIRVATNATPIGKMVGALYINQKVVATYNLFNWLFGLLWSYYLLKYKLYFADLFL